VTDINPTTVIDLRRPLPHYNVENDALGRLDVLAASGAQWALLAHRRVVHPAPRAR
jgi:hypothetical protein